MLTVYQTLYIPLSSLSSSPVPLCPLPVFLSSLPSSKARTFIEHFWYASNCVLSLLSSCPSVSTDSASLCFFLLSAREENGHLLSTYCVPDSFLTLPQLFTSLSSLISNFFLFHQLFLKDKNKQLWAPTVYQSINIPLHLLLPLSRCPSRSASLSPCSVLRVLFRGRVQVFTERLLCAPWFTCNAFSLHILSSARFLSLIPPPSAPPPQWRPPGPTPFPLVPVCAFTSVLFSCSSKEDNVHLLSASCVLATSPAHLFSLLLFSLPPSLLQLLPVLSALPALSWERK